MLHRKNASPGRPYCFFVEAEGVHGGVYELRLASHSEEGELPGLALTYLERISKACLRLLTAAQPTVDALESNLQVQQNKSEVMVLWGRGVLARVPRQGPDPTVSALNAALLQLQTWRSEVLVMYQVKEQEQLH